MSREIDNLRKEFLKELEEFAGRGMQRFSDAFREWARMAALPFLSGTAVLAGDEKGHERYEAEYQKTLARRKGYCENPAKTGGRLLAIVSEALTLERRDFLGKCMEDGVAATNRKNGQVFTPPHIARLMAKSQLGDAKEMLADNGFVSVYEPCCGTGIISIEALDELLEQGIDQRDIWLEAEDIDEGALACAYVQVSLLGFAGCFRLGDTLAMKFREQAYTPGAFMHGTLWRVLDWRRKPEKAEECAKTGEQMVLFG